MTTSFPPDTNEDGLRDLVTTFQGLHDWIDVSGGMEGGDLDGADGYKQSLVEKNTLLEKENSELKNAKDAARMLRKENDRLKKQQQRDSSNSVSSRCLENVRDSDDTRMELRALLIPMTRRVTTSWSS